MTVTPVHRELLIEACIILTVESDRQHEHHAEIISLANRGLIERIAAETGYYRTADADAAGNPNGEFRQASYAITEAGKRVLVGHAKRGAHA